MKILHIETSSRNCSVALSEGENLLCLCEEVSEGYKQSEKLHTFIQWALEGAELTLQDVDAVALGQGPGSYTGLRIGSASAKGFCFALDLPLLAVDSMISMVQPFIGGDYDYIIPLLDARRMEVYTAVFDGKTGNQISPTEAKILTDESFAAYQDFRILFVGDGAAKAESILRLPRADFRSDLYPSAKYQISAAVEKFRQKDFEDVAYYEPFYLKEFQGIKKKKSED